MNQQKMPEASGDLQRPPGHVHVHLKLHIALQDLRRVKHL